jgi:glycosyltransferase involved in cell wall biosynthesis
MAADASRVIAARAARLLLRANVQTAQDFTKAGVARYTASIVEAFVQMKDSSHEFHLFLLPTLEEPEHWRTAPHVRIHRTWKRYNKWNLVMGGLEAKRHGIDFWFSTAHTVPFFSSVKKGLMIHDLFPLRYPEMFPEDQLGFYRKMIPRSCRVSDVLFANSEDTKNDIVDMFGTDPAKIVVTPLGPGNVIRRRDPAGVDAAELAAAGVPEGTERYLLTLSTLEPRKNLAGLIRAMAILREEPEFADVRLMVAGGKGWKYQEVFDLVEHLNMADQVRFLGYVPDEALPGLFARCEAYVCPSITEGFGMPVLEAMIAGAPIVASNGGAIPEVAGNLARYFDPYDPADIARAIREQLRGSDRAAKVEQGFERAQQFSWDRCARLTIEGIERACG